MITSATRRAFQSLIAAACVDRRLADKERQYLLGKAREFGIPTEDFEQMLQQGLEGRLTVSVPPTPEGKQALLGELIDIVCADGRVESQEQQLLARFAAHLGADPGDLMQRVRDRLNRRRNEAADSAPARPPAVRRAEPPPAPRPAPPPPRQTAPPPAPARVELMERVEHPQPIRFLDAPPDPSEVAKSPFMEGHENLLAVLAGPMKLGAAGAFVTNSLPPVTRVFVALILGRDGRDEAVRHVLNTCGVSDEAEARRLVDLIITEDRVVPKSVKAGP